MLSLLFYLLRGQDCLSMNVPYLSKSDSWKTFSCINKANSTKNKPVTASWSPHPVSSPPLQCRCHGLLASNRRDVAKVSGCVIMSMSSHIREGSAGLAGLSVPGWLCCKQPCWASPHDKTLWVASVC